MSDWAVFSSWPVLSNNSAFSLMKFFCILDICAMILARLLAAASAFFFRSASFFSEIKLEDESESSNGALPCCKFVTSRKVCNVQFLFFPCKSQFTLTVLPGFAFQFIDNFCCSTIFRTLPAHITRSLTPSLWMLECPCRDSNSIMTLREPLFAFSMNLDTP